MKAIVDTDFWTQSQFFLQEQIVITTVSSGSWRAREASREVEHTDFTVKGMKANRTAQEYASSRLIHSAVLRACISKKAEI